MRSLFGNTLFIKCDAGSRFFETKTKFLTSIILAEILSLKRFYVVTRKSKYTDIHRVKVEIY